jgi:hypothetical protein
MSMTFCLDSFSFRQFDDPSYSGTQIAAPKEEFLAAMNALVDAGSAPLVDGYAPFCKHIFCPNTYGAVGSTLSITEENRGLLISEYEARTEKELPVLVRYFPRAAVARPPTAFLDVILYSREQIAKEHAATGTEDTAIGDREAPWRIISIKAQDVERELPMQPITMMRNALGVEEGGSGVALERRKYDDSVAFWKTHANIK